MRGKISQWKDDKGFGFISHEGSDEKSFFHISSVESNGRRPQVGDVVSFQPSKDSQGRNKALSVQIDGIKNRPEIDLLQKDIMDVVGIALLIVSIVAVAYFFYQAYSPKTYIPIAIPFFISIMIFSRQKKPKSKTFTCTKCNSIASHDSRTIRAWNDGHKRLFCGACHRKWIDTQPKQVKESYSSSGANSGCLGVVLVFIVMPAIACITAINLLA